MVTVLGFALIGSAYGYAFHSGVWALFAATCYGLLGAVVGAPLGMLINLIRSV